MADREREIRDLAHRIWEEAGRPTGDDARHWSEAERRYDALQKTDPKPDKNGAKTKVGKASKAPEPALAKVEKAAKPKAAEAPKPKSKAEAGKAKGRDKAKR